MKSFIRIKLKESTNLLTEISVDDAWKTIYSNKEKYPLLNGDVDSFNALNNLIPSKGTEFNKAAFSWLYNLKKQGRLKDEDTYKAKDYLRIFFKFFNRIPKEKRNLMAFKTLPELYDVISEFSGNEDQPVSNSKGVKDIKSELNKVYEDDYWKVIIPTTQRASCLVGKGTQWCTAADVSNNYFDYYNKTGRLLVIINKETNDKYQAHLESGEFNDSRDNSISAVDFFEHYDDTNGVQTYLETRPNFWEWVLESSVDDVVGSDGYGGELFSEALTKATDDKIKKSVLSQLRGSENSEAMYMGFMYEEDPYDITQSDIGNLTTYDDENDNLQYIINHLIEIEFDFTDVDNVGNVSLGSYVQGKKELDNHNLELDKVYNIDKGRVLMIDKINFTPNEPTYTVSVSQGKKQTSGSVNIETLINLIHQHQLFEKTYLKTLLRTKLLK